MSRFDLNKNRMRDQSGNPLPIRKNWQFAGFTATDDPEGDSTILTPPVGSGVPITVAKINVTADGTLGVGALASADWMNAASAILTASANRNIYGGATDLTPGQMMPYKSITNGNAPGGSDFIVHHNHGSVAGGTQNRIALPTQEGTSYTIKPGETIVWARAEATPSTDGRWAKEADADALVSSQLAPALTGVRGRRTGEVRKTKGITAANDGCEGDYEWESGNTTAGRAGMVYVVPGHGRWTRIVRNKGFVPASDIGVKGEEVGVTQQHDLLLEGLAECSDRKVYKFVLPAGEILCRPSTTSAPLLLPSGKGFVFSGAGASDTKLVMAQNYSNGAAERYLVDATGFDITVKGFTITIPAATLSMLPDPDPGTPLTSGQYLHGVRINGFNIHLSDLHIFGCSGSGVIDNGAGGSFQCQMRRVTVEQCGADAFKIAGNNTWGIRNCAAGGVAKGFAGLRIDSGHVSIRNFNGLFASYFRPGLPVGFKGVDTIVAYVAADAFFDTCNFEDFRWCGLEIATNRAPKLQNCTFFSAPGGTNGRVRAIIAGAVDTPQELDGSNRFFDPGVGTYGTPGVGGATDGNKFQASSGLPAFSYRGVDFGNWTIGGTSVNSGTVTIEQVGSGSYAASHKHIKLKNYYFDFTLHGSAGTLQAGPNQCYMGSSYAMDLPSPLATVGDEVDVRIRGGTGTLTVNSPGGFIFLPDGTPVTSIAWNVRNKNVTFRRGYGNNGTTDDILGWVVHAGMAVVTVSATIADISTAGSVYVNAPVSGRIVKIYSALGGAITTANAALTTAIQPKAGGGFAAITAGGLTVAFSGSAAGDSDEATPSAANIVAAGDTLRVTTDGASDTAAPVTVTFAILAVV